jgi:hypothetical protein
MESVLKRLRILEEGISEVRKTPIPTWFHNLETPEEVSLIRQAKREHHPVFAELSGDALVELNHEAFWKGIAEGIIDRISYSPNLESFLQKAVEDSRISPENVQKLAVFS